MGCVGGAADDIKGQKKYDTKVGPHHECLGMLGQGACPQFSKHNSMGREKSWLELCLERHSLS